MPRYAKNSDGETDAKAGYRTRGTVNIETVDCPLRRSSRVKSAVKQNESSPESPSSIYSNISNAQSVRNTKRQTDTLNNSTMTERSRSLRIRRSFIVSDAIETLDKHSPIGTPTRRTRNISTSNGVNKFDEQTSFTKRLTTADSESKSPPIITKPVRRTRASSTEREAVKKKTVMETTNSESAYNTVSMKKSMALLKTTVIEEDEEKMFPFVALERMLPNLNESNETYSENSTTKTLNKSISKEKLNSSSENTSKKEMKADANATNEHSTPVEHPINKNTLSDISEESRSESTHTVTQVKTSTLDLDKVKSPISAEVTQRKSRLKNESSMNNSLKEKDERLSNKENLASNIIEDPKSNDLTVSNILSQSPQPLIVNDVCTKKCVKENDEDTDSSDNAQHLVVTDTESLSDTPLNNRLYQSTLCIEVCEDSSLDDSIQIMKCLDNVNNRDSLTSLNDCEDQTASSIEMQDDLNQDGDNPIQTCEENISDTRNNKSSKYNNNKKEQIQLISLADETITIDENDEIRLILEPEETVNEDEEDPEEVCVTQTATADAKCEGNNQAGVSNKSGNLSLSFGETTTKDLRETEVAAEETTTNDLQDTEVAAKISGRKSVTKKRNSDQNSENKCNDFVLEDKEVSHMEKNIGKEKESLNYDSDDTVLLKAQTNLLKEKTVEQMDTSGSQCETNENKSAVVKDMQWEKIIAAKANCENQEERVEDQTDNVKNEENVSTRTSIKNKVSNQSLLGSDNCIEKQADTTLTNKIDQTLNTESPLNKKKGKSKLSEGGSNERKSIRKSVDKSDNKVEEPSNVDTVDEEDSLSKSPIGSPSNASDSNKTDESMDSDVEREYNLNGADICKFSDDDVPGDDCRASETESSDPNDDGSDLADFVVNDDDEISEEVESSELDEESSNNHDKHLESDKGVIGEHSRKMQMLEESDEKRTKTGKQKRIDRATSEKGKSKSNKSEKLGFDEVTGNEEKITDSEIGTIGKKKKIKRCIEEEEIDDDQKNLEYKLQIREEEITEKVTKTGRRMRGVEGHIEGIENEYVDTPKKKQSKLRKTTKLDLPEVSESGESAKCKSEIETDNKMKKIKEKDNDNKMLKEKAVVVHGNRPTECTKTVVSSKRVKRLAEEDIETLSDLSVKVSKKRKLSKPEQEELPSLSIPCSELRKRNINVEQDFILLNSYGSTSNFYVENLQKMRRSEKTSRMRLYRLRMLNRYRRQPKYFKFCNVYGETTSFE